MYARKPTRTTKAAEYQMLLKPRRNAQAENNGIEGALRMVTSAALLKTSKVSQKSFGPSGNSPKPTQI